MSWYCAYSRDKPLHKHYHDTEHGFPSTSERVLFERLALEIMQAGLSWDIVLKKREALNAAFARFAPSKVAAYGARDVARLLKDASIIRNRRKIEAIIENARRIVALRRTHGGFAKWLAAQHPRPRSAWVKLFRQQFVFMGPEIVNEFLMGFSLRPGAHSKSCPIYRKTKAVKRY
jgi:DNA-3-methyladenine glycosylase I